MGSPLFSQSVLYEEAVHIHAFSLTCREWDRGKVSHNLLFASLQFSIAVLLDLWVVTPLGVE